MVEHGHKLEILSSRKKVSPTDQRSPKFRHRVCKESPTQNWFHTLAEIFFCKLNALKCHIFFIIFLIVIFNHLNIFYPHGLPSAMKPSQLASQSYQIPS